LNIQLAIALLGEYGLPFIFERISSDFGAVSTYSSIVFDQGVMAVSDRGVIQAAANGLTRLDEQIPEQVFSFEIQNNALILCMEFVFRKRTCIGIISIFPINLHSVLSKYCSSFQLSNNTWAKFRDNITCFGRLNFNLVLLGIV